MKSFGILLKNEWKLNVRNMNMVIFAVIMPLVVSEYRERKILKRFQVTPVSPVRLLAVEFAIYSISHVDIFRGNAAL
jgi:ABC-2 type transport system permease protein